MRRCFSFVLVALALAACAGPPAGSPGFAPYENLISPTTQFGGGGGSGSM